MDLLKFLYNFLFSKDKTINKFQNSLPITINNLDNRKNKVKESRQGNQMPLQMV
jgi:hypothetical protein